MTHPEAEAINSFNSAALAMNNSLRIFKFISSESSRGQEAGK